MLMVTKYLLHIVHNINKFPFLSNCYSLLKGYVFSGDIFLLLWNIYGIFCYDPH